MSDSYTTSILGSILVSLLITLLIAWVSIKIAWRYRLIDVPESAPHKRHTATMPLAGGIALFVVMITLALAYRLVDDPEIRAILISSVVVFLVGIWDDSQGIPPWLKLLGQVLAVSLLIYQGVYVRIFESPGFFIHGQSGFYVGLDWLLTSFWMVGITNAFNFVDSMDGLAAALAGIAAAFFMLVTLDSSQPILSLQTGILLGSCIGLYFFNAPPARMFLGDAGAQMLGFLLGAVAIVYTPDPQVTFQTSSWFVPIIILGVPIFDATLVVISRLRRRRPVYKSALDHTYHRLVRLGVESNRAVMTMHIAALALGCLAFIALNLSPLFANTIFITVLVLGAGILVFLDRRYEF